MYANHLEFFWDKQEYKLIGEWRTIEWRKSLFTTIKDRPEVKADVLNADLGFKKYYLYVYVRGREKENKFPSVGLFPRCP